MSLDKPLYPLLSTVSTQEDKKMSQYDLKIADLDVNINGNRQQILIISSKKRKPEQSASVALQTSP